MAKPVLVTRKRNVTRSVSFGRQIGFRFTVFNTNSNADQIIKKTFLHSFLLLVKDRLSLDKYIYVSKGKSKQFDEKQAWGQLHSNVMHYRCITFEFACITLPLLYILESNA